MCAAVYGVHLDAVVSYLTPSVFKVVSQKSKLPEKSINLSFAITRIKNKSTELCGN
jgi:hypothetical protein